MTETATASVPAQAAPPAPAQTPHESLAERAAGWFHHAEADAQAVAQALPDEAKALFRSHAAEVFSLASQVLSSPELSALEPRVLSLAETALHIAGAAVHG